MIRRPAARPWLLAALFGVCLVPKALAGDSPAFSASTYDRTLAALREHKAIAARGGWPLVPREAFGAKLGTKGPAVAALKQRLAASGDLSAAATSDDIFDATLEAALRRFQARHGLSLTGSVGALTLKALNQPISERLEALEASLARLRGNGFVFTNRYVVVNIPAATVEAIENDRVVNRFTAVVGRKDRQSPVLETRITAVNLNPTWTAPLSIIKKDILPKVQRDRSFLASSNMRVFVGGQEVDPSTIDWNATGSVNFSIRQDPGPTNALGRIRIDMPNRHAVYIHDTPKKELFRSDVRFHSSGCARVQNVDVLAAWLLEGTEWTAARIKAAIEAGERRDIKLARAVPIAWVYLTAWADADGTVQFREDIYDLDNEKGVAATTIVARAPTAPGATVARSFVAAHAQQTQDKLNPINPWSADSR